MKLCFFLSFLFNIVSPEDQTSRSCRELPQKANLIPVWSVKICPSDYILNLLSVYLIERHLTQKLHGLARGWLVVISLERERERESSLYYILYIYN